MQISFNNSSPAFLQNRNLAISNNRSLSLEKKKFAYYNDNMQIDEGRLRRFITTHINEIDDELYNKIDAFYDIYTETENAIQKDENIDILEKLASKYAELRNNILNDFSNEDAQKHHLEQLDKAYEISSEKITGLITNKIISPLKDWALTRKIWGGENSIRFFGVNNGLQAIDDAEYNFIYRQLPKQLTSNLRTLSQMAKTFYMNNNDITEFSNFMSQGSDGTFGNFSYDDIKYLLFGDKAETSDTYDKLQFSDDVKYIMNASSELRALRATAQSYKSQVNNVDVVDMQLEKAIQLANKPDNDPSYLEKFSKMVEMYSQFSSIENQFNYILENTVAEV